MSAPISTDYYYWERKYQDACTSLAAIHYTVQRNDVDKAVLLSIRDECEHVIPALKTLRNPQFP